jgi:hypothetical protein
MALSTDTIIVLAPNRTPGKQAKASSRIVVYNNTPHEINNKRHGYNE